MARAKIIEPKDLTSEKSIDSRTVLHKPQNKTAVNKDSIEGMTPETDKKVTGTFVNIECPGQPAKICGRYYRGMQYFNETLEHDKQYTIPLSIARFINERCKHEKHTNILDEQGNPIKGNQTFPRYKFLIESYV